MQLPIITYSYPLLPIIILLPVATHFSYLLSTVSYLLLQHYCTYTVKNGYSCGNSKRVVVTPTCHGVVFRPKCLKTTPFGVTTTPHF